MLSLGAVKGLLQGHGERNRWLMSPKPQLLEKFQQSIFKAKVREGNPRVRDQLMHSSVIG